MPGNNGVYMCQPSRRRCTGRRMHARHLWQCPDIGPADFARAAPAPVAYQTHDLFTAIAARIPAPAMSMAA